MNIHQEENPHIDLGSYSVLRLEVYIFVSLKDNYLFFIHFYWRIIEILPTILFSLNYFFFNQKFKYFANSL